MNNRKENNFVREVLYYKDYYLSFFKDLKPEVKRKINWTIQLICTLERIPVRYFKSVSSMHGIFEIRIEVGTDIFRVFCCFDKGNLIILMNGFQKKSQKTPLREIKFAEKIKKQYFEEKEKK